MPASNNDALVDIADQFVDAYNQQNFPALRALLASPFYFQHYNRDFEFRDPDAFVETLEVFAKQLLPDRRFEAPLRTTQAGNIVVRQHSWGGTAAGDIPGMANAGDVLKLDLCSIFVFDGELIAEYHDYG